MHDDAVKNALSASRVVAIIRGLGPEQVRGVARALLNGGIRCIEVTLNSPGAIESIGIIASEFPEVVPGAGTVLEVEEVKEAVAIGARFIVSPNVDPRVIEETKALGRISIPGAMTPTEIVQALKAGADYVKIFPASVVGYKFFREMKGPFGDLKMVATGGITPDDAAEYIRNGSYAVGLGSSLVPKEAVLKGDYKVIENLARKLVESVRSALGA
ncbi:MAG: bifunctional 4-hydroxy-2-oxoglutarate aldolase/2-dehydro-3-deoxy-phosphogluconate aldolase [Candidatus Fermentithermobacillus carboniphilus]|uniref:Bifunctional 4-hydroxy-2-oxoglutarate aldolase/2-dehydro-3-deoxy-phosphogluconate aldolase n=1 Tax=Candidatus Fermentithermobacillus carboniphilus TaxID=3085328 RepID=A0AAT9LCY0_9FIRM|nr:MAG: bifunctional 4-hydroxy-2-oxoglutarate aldolase/2-dehydro-3-deoxy-phosphogluconate aldolase [Candidatus Fermentithermobacillus carboniphilus]